MESNYLLYSYSNSFIVIEPFGQLATPNERFTPSKSVGKLCLIDMESYEPTPIFHLLACCSYKRLLCRHAHADGSMYPTSSRYCKQVHLLYLGIRLAFRCDSSLRSAARCFATPVASLAYVVTATVGRRRGY
jgi:hypothetical protein